MQNGASKHNTVSFQLCDDINGSTLIVQGTQWQRVPLRNVQYQVADGELRRSVVTLYICSSRCEDTILEDVPCIALNLDFTAL